jgi:hypothetical protein
MNVFVIVFVVILIAGGLYFAIKSYLEEDRNKEKSAKSFTASGKDSKKVSTPRKKTTKK